MEREKEEEEKKEEEEEKESDEEEDDSEFDDPEDYVDNVTDEELLGDLLQERPAVETGVENIIVVDNAPKVGPDRIQKLKTVLSKVFGRFGKIVRDYYPTDESNVFKGYFFLEFSSREEAEAAVNTGNGYKLDKAHVFATNFFADFEKYASLSDKWKVPTEKEFVEVGNLRSWLLEENCYDQISVIFSGGEKVAVSQNTGKEPKLVTERSNWTDTYVRWSPRGTYLATLHKQGVALWGGPKFERLGRFSHNGVQMLDFSPCERYLVTFSNIVDDPNSPNSLQNISVWDVRTGRKRRSFMRGDAEDWPIIKWNYDGKYFARMNENLLSVFETPSFGLLDKKSLVIKGIKDFSWCPSRNCLAYWVPEINQIPAKIIVIEIPSRKELATKSRMLVEQFKLHWHKQGDYLCVRVDHYLTKSKKKLCSSFEIFHMREPLIPVDTIELKEAILAFALEPKGSKFAVLHGDPPTRITATFYKIEKGAAINKLRTLERREANHIFWCPNGQFVVLAGLKMSSQLEFIDTADMTSMNSVDHGAMTGVEWDPTGRYVVSTVSFWSQKMDTGFCMWSFQGSILYRNPMQMDKICQVLWRPRPPSLLAEEDLQTIKRDIKKYQVMFEQRDRSTRTKASRDLMEKRRKVMKDFTDYRHKRLEQMKERMEVFMENLPQVDDSYEEQVSDEVISVSEETVQ